MKKPSLSLFALLAAGAVCAADAVNFYPNAELAGKNFPKGYYFTNHWSRGKVSPAADSGKKAAVRLDVVPAATGKADGIVCTDKGVSLKPGSYCLSVECRPETDLDSVYLYVSWQGGDGKRASSSKTFAAADLPKGKWTRILCYFDVKPGFDKFAFGYGVRSKAAAGVSFTAPRVEKAGLYINPYYQKKTLPNGKLTLENHWYEGKVSLDGENYQDMPAVKIESVKAKWGSGIFVGTVSGQVIPALTPGKYLLAVRCRPAEGAKYRSFVLYFTRKLSGEAKRTMIRKTYDGTSIPEAGKWTELVMPVEVKTGDEQFSFAYGFLGNQVLSASFADPKIIKDEEE